MWSTWLLYPCCLVVCLCPPTSQTFGRGPVMLHAPALSHLDAGDGLQSASKLGGRWAGAHNAVELLEVAEAAQDAAAARRGGLLGRQDLHLHPVELRPQR